MVLNGEEGLECEVHVDGARLEYASEFKYLRCVLDESCTDGAECSRKASLDERIDEAALRCFEHMERMERDRIVYVGECAGSR